MRSEALGGTISNIVLGAGGKSFNNPSVMGVLMKRVTLAMKELIANHFELALEFAAVCLFVEDHWKAAATVQVGAAAVQGWLDSIGDTPPLTLMTVLHDGLTAKYGGDYAEGSSAKALAFRKTVTALKAKIKESALIMANAFEYVVVLLQFFSQPRPKMLISACRARIASRQGGRRAGTAH